MQASHLLDRLGAAPRHQRRPHQDASFGGGGGGWRLGGLEEGAGSASGSIAGAGLARGASCASSPLPLAAEPSACTFTGGPSLMLLGPSLGPARFWGLDGHVRKGCVVRRRCVAYCKGGGAVSAGTRRGLRRLASQHAQPVPSPVVADAFGAPSTPLTCQPPPQSTTQPLLPSQRLSNMTSVPPGERAMGVCSP